MSNEKNQSTEKNGFLATLKSNPQTLDEAKKKTKANCILCAIVFGVFVILFSLLHILFGVLWAVAAAGIILYLKFKWDQKNKRNFCADCGARFDYEECVSWEVSEVERKTMNPDTNSQTKKAIQKDVATHFILHLRRNFGNFVHRHSPYFLPILTRFSPKCQSRGNVFLNCLHFFHAKGLQG